TLSCGGSTSENCTYLVEASSSNPTSDPCTFTICKCSSNICRIRLDFTTFSIAGGAIGDCTTDSFSVTSPGNYGSPLICGFNTGQHMILDASDLCHRAHFDFSGTSISRQFDIKGLVSKFQLIDVSFNPLMTQYACGDEGGGKLSNMSPELYRPLHDMILYFFQDRMAVYNILLETPEHLRGMGIYKSAINRTMQ
ncbi:hypothetical protein TCAL_16301, partial [Tigriopus californicus]